MPIKDFEGRGRIPRLGKIRLGEKVHGEKSDYPKATDHFVCPIEVRAVYGEKPKKLDISFHTDNIEEIFPQYYKRYGKSTGLVCKGDGEIANLINPETSEFEEVECLGRGTVIDGVRKSCEYWEKGQCKTIGNLYFMVRGVNRFGVYQLDTSSYNTILNINGGLDYAKRLTGGRLALIPFILEVIPQEVNPEGKKKTVYVLRLEADIAKMMKSLDLKPQELFLESAKPNEIEEDLYPNGLVESMKKEDRPMTKIAWAKFWIATQKLGWSRDEVHDFAGVESIKDWTHDQTAKLYLDIVSFIKDQKDKEQVEIDDQSKNPFLKDEPAEQETLEVK